ncbi:MAG TPA: PKD domain-containing protein [Bacteroidia bacterium]|nr:PKD domain-containing protein [Bacteroidia bacterium]
MKTKITIIISTLCLLFSIITKAQQNGFINIGPLYPAGFPNPMVCNEAGGNYNNFILDVNSYSACTLFITMNAPCILSGTCNQNPYEFINLPGITYNAVNNWFELPVLQGLNSFVYQLNIDCSLLECAASQSPSVNVDMVFSSSDGQNWNVNSPNGLPNGIDTYTMNVQTFSIINLGNANTAYPTAYNQYLTLTFQYTNPTTTEAHVAIKFELDPYPCGRFNVENGGTYSITSPVSISGNNFGQYVAPINIPPGGTLSISVDIHIIDCEDQCPDDINAKLEYVCADFYLDPDYCSAPNHCKNTVSQWFSLPDDLDLDREVSITRLLPVNLWQAEAEQCFGDNLVWRYRVENTGQVDIAMMTLKLSDFTNGNSFSKVISSSVTPFPNCGLCNVVSTTSNNCNSPSCTYCGGTTLLNWTMIVQNIPANGGAIEVEFTTNLCCYDAEAQVMNQPKYINQWNFQVSVEDECELNTFTTIPLPNPSTLNTWDQAPYHGLSGGISFYSHENTVSPFVDLHQDITYIPIAPFDLYGNSNEQAPIEMPFNFDSPTSGDRDFNLFFNTYPFDMANPLPSGVLKVVIEMDEGLNLLNSNTPVSAVSITHSNNDPNFILQPLAGCFVDNLPLGYSIQPCANNPLGCATNGLYCAKAYEYYFDLEDQIGALAISLGQTPMFILNQLLQHGRLNFTMYSSCDACQPMAGYRVKYYLAPKKRLFSSLPCGGYYCYGAITATGDPFCWIPLASKDAVKFVHCAGCVTPGIIVDNDVIRRTTYGFEDPENDAVINTSAPVPITPLYSEFNLINDERSFRGDLIESTLEAHFENGAFPPNAWMYSHMQSNGAELTHLYLEKYFPKTNNLTGFDVQWTSVDFTVTGASGDEWIINTYTNPNTNVEYVINTEKFYVKIFRGDVIPAPSCTNCIPPFAFNVDQTYKLIFRFKVCGNQPPTDYHLDDHFSLVINRMCLVRDVVNPITPISAISSLPEANGTDYSSLLTPQDWQDYAEAHQFICEGGGAGHTFFSLQSINNLGDYFGYPCNPLSTPWAATTIAGGAEMSFEYEFRPPPISLTDYIVNVPTGFDVDILSPPTTTAHYRRYDDWDDLCTPCCNPIGCVNGCAFTQSPLATTFNFNNDPDIPSISYYTPETTTNPAICVLPFGEEVFLERYSIRYVPNCDVPYSNVVDIPLSTYEATFRFTDCNGGTNTYQQPLSYGYSDPNPAPMLNLNFYPTAILSDVNTTQVCWDFIIANSSAASDAAYNLYMYINPALTSPYLANWIIEADLNCDGNYSSLVFSGGVYQLVNALNNPLNPGDYYCFRVCADLISCPPPNLVFPITVNWGWDCQGFPTDQNYAQTCFADQRTISIQRALYNLNSSYDVYDANGPITQFNLCDPFTVEACFNSDQPGLVTLISTVSLTISGLLNTQILIAEWYNPATGIFLTCNQYPSGLDWVADISIPDLCNLGYGLGYPLNECGYLHAADIICIRLRLVQNCDAATIALPTITLHCESFCGDQWPEIAVPVPPILTYSTINNCSFSCKGAPFDFDWTYVPPCIVNFQITIFPCPSPISYWWDFGDGNYSTLANPSHTYQYSGTYNVCLTIICEGGICCTYCEEVTINDCRDDCGTPLFTYFPMDNCLDIMFVNLSTPCPAIYSTTYFWDFGDFTSMFTNSTASFIHSYASPGTYYVCLRILCYQINVPNIDSTLICKELESCQWVTVCDGGEPPRQLIYSGESEPDFSIKIVPNPVVEDRFDLIINSDRDGKMQLSIINYLGAHVMSTNLIIRKGYNRKELELPDIMEGVYLVNISDGINQKSLRFSVIK